MNDKQQHEILTDVLRALFGPSFKGKYVVEVRKTFTIDANDKHDAIAKAKEHIQSNIDDLIFTAYKIEDLVKE